MECLDLMLEVTDGDPEGLQGRERVLRTGSRGRSLGVRVYHGFMWPRRENESTVGKLLVRV